MKKIVVCIGREFGSGGLYISQLLSKELKIPVYDKEILSISSKDSGLDKRLFEKIDENCSYSILQKALGKLALFDNYDNYMYNENIFQIQSDTIRKLYEQGSCIFVGRCADYILRDKNDVIKVFLSANKEDKINSVIKKFSCTRENAIKMLENTEKKRSSYYNFYTNKEWGKASSYDICINTSYIGVKNSANLLLNIIKSSMF